MALIRTLEALSHPHLPRLSLLVHSTLVPFVDPSDTALPCSVVGGVSRREGNWIRRGIVAQPFSHLHPPLSDPKRARHTSPSYIQSVPQTLVYTTFLVPPSAEPQPGSLILAPRLPSFSSDPCFLHSFCTAAAARRQPALDLLPTGATTVYGSTPIKNHQKAKRVGARLANISLPDLPRHVTPIISCSILTH
ncbi:hypothetical protein BDP81DRAFT_439236 [Colletotrichum phormii]|uniref:Uncharacterized protein n=1 Tax=Colletotrichum phormii TaxID=359342 RepID=A0AAI9ZFT1_9PEZI|nr:uncharacterized protein BDP81DRAFT_439236 [Colletotrichum phormii]KAK1623636.1 hypothetical protein BDP81DRAFT_439236 [Colletotrichum phormii]